MAFGSRDGYQIAGQMVLHNFKGTWKGKKPTAPVAAAAADSVVPASRQVSETGAAAGAAKNGGKATTCVDLGSSQATLCVRSCYLQQVVAGVDIDVAHHFDASERVFDMLVVDFLPTHTYMTGAPSPGRRRPRGRASTNLLMITCERSGSCLWISSEMTAASKNSWPQTAAGW